MIKNTSKYQVATALAILFHFFGIIGILFWDKTLFVEATPLNLLLMFILLIWTQEDRKNNFLIFVLIAIFIGFMAEVIGVNTGLLFGDYNYGKALGIRILQVPLIIGINWFVIIYCSGISIQTMMNKLVKGGSVKNQKLSVSLKIFSGIIDGAILATLFDWLMEPIAIKLGFWQWSKDGSIPVYNYICWFLISASLLTIFQFFNFRKENKFAINLLLIQVMFFLLLRTFL